MILTAAVSTSNQRDRVRLRCHGQSCLYYQQIEEEGPSRRVFPSRKRTLHLPRTLYSGYRSARVGQPVILVLTLISFSLSLSLRLPLVLSLDGKPSGNNDDRREGRGGKAKFRSSTTTTTTTSVLRATLLSLS